jgi:hypothetical protein
MYSAYIKPFLAIFPFSPWVAELFDFLKPGFQTVVGHRRG